MWRCCNSCRPRRRLLRHIMLRSLKSYGLRQGHPQWIRGDIHCGFAFFWPLLKGSEATGLAALAALFVESIFSPRFWIVGILLFGLFFAASRSSSILRVLFFWIPTLVVSALGFAVFGDVHLSFHTLHTLQTSVIFAQVPFKPASLSGMSRTVHSTF
jgi:hypothetical protein